VTRITNRHIQQNNAIVFADDPIGLADDYLITMFTKELHDRWFSNANADDQLPLE
jgi:hypothetical protein